MDAFERGRTLCPLQSPQDSIPPPLPVILHLLGGTVLTPLCPTPLPPPPLLFYSHSITGLKPQEALTRLQKLLKLSF